MTLELNPVLTPLAFLIGQWEGTGRGWYPTISDFSYREVSRFWSTGRNVLHYEQLTADPSTGEPMHCETGYLRVDGSHVELVVAHPLGIVEIEEGNVEGHRLTLETTFISSSSTAEKVAALARAIEVVGDELSYALSMKAARQPLSPHLEATLTRRS